MKASATEFDGVTVIEPEIFTDVRGSFYESFNQRKFAELIADVSFVQDNQSFSKKGVVRGLHYQLPPKAQGKLVRVLAGEIFDVAVDIRRDSPSFGRWVGAELSATNKRQMWIPEGFAHGFLALADDTHFLYKTTDVYDKASEGAILWSDPDLAIAWPGDPGSFIVNEKDALAPRLRDAAA